MINFENTANKINNPTPLSDEPTPMVIAAALTLELPLVTTSSISVKVFPPSKAVS